MPYGPGGATPVKRRILIVDAHPLLRRGLAALIDGESDLIVCGQAASAQAALAAIAADGPDLVIADFSLEDSVGLALAAEIRASHPELPVLLMSIDDNALGCERALLAGARGCVSKRELDGTALDAIHAALE
jgi:DNA-binding NarL/FixJ family response regulator